MEKILKIAFMPLSIATGLGAGMIARKIFGQMWGLIDDYEPPTPKHRGISWPKLLGALLLEGAIFRLVRGVVDRELRAGFAGLTGTWPGETQPEAE